MEAKGPGYDQWFDRTLEPKFDFKGIVDLERQARNQNGMAGGLPIRWHVAEPRMVAVFKKLFAKWGIKGIEVVHTPPIP